MASANKSSESATHGLLGSGSAFIFSGQGSQTVGMGQDLYYESPAARRVFDEAEQALGTSLTEVMFQGPAKMLERTINSQPAILTVSLACLAATSEQVGVDVVPQAHFMAGHSLGEYTALAAAGVLDVGEAVWLVRERGRLMQEACDQCAGAMTAILDLEEAVVEEVCRETSTQIANINTPGQIVISGEESNIAKAMALASDRGARRTVPLRVSGAFHSYLMASAMEGMVKALNSVHFRNPVIPVIANCTAKPVTAIEDVKEELTQQLCGCVRWRDSISYMVGEGVTNFVEFGPGGVLSGMVKRIATNVNVASVTDVSSAHKINNGLQRELN